MPQFFFQITNTVALLALAWIGLVIFPGRPAAAGERPNVVVIYADDLGYGDVRCYNPDRGRIPTPHIDRLAAEGMRFTDGHSSSGVCSPSRYTLLAEGGTGKPGPGPEDVTAAHRAAWQRVFSQPIAGGPTARGFDAYFGTDVPNWPPFCFIENDRTVGIPTTLLPPADFLNHRASKQGPAVAGWQLEAVLPALRDRAVAFIEEVGKGPAPFLLYLPLTSPHTPLAVNEPWRGKSGLDNAYADLVMETDAVVGDVLATIERAGVADRTLVVFTSDNGFAPYVGAAELEQRGHFPSGPLRGYKSDAWEGGHRVPFIVRYPGVTRPGSVCHALVHQADVMATLADVLGAELPLDAGADSVSLLSLLEGGTEPVRQHAVSCSSRGMPAIRDGRWKLILGKGSGGWSKGGDEGPDVQLYDLEADLGERRNLAAEEPERVRAMKAAYEAIVAAGRSRSEASPVE